MTASPGLGRDIRLLVADVDKTILTSDHAIAPSTVQAARALKVRGIALALASSRPPRGLLAYIDTLGIEIPCGAFNGGVFVAPDLTVLSESPLPAAVAREAIALLGQQGLDAWAYSADEWYVLDAQGSHVAHEAGAVAFQPKVVDSYEPVMADVVKIVGVSDDPAVMAAAEEAVHGRFGAQVSASCSQTYYLDITHPDADKGKVVDWLSARLGIPSGNIATIGDGGNDILMFRRSGLSIAMGNALPEVKAEATTVTSSNDDDGFARAVEAHILSMRER